MDMYYRSTTNNIAFNSLRVSGAIKVSDTVKINGSEIGVEPIINIHGKTGQVNPLFNIENSNGTDFFTVDANGGVIFSGLVTLAGGVSTTTATFTNITLANIHATSKATISSRWLALMSDKYCLISTSVK